MTPQQYLDKYVFDFSVKKEYCIKHKLPYVTEDGRLMNTDWFCEDARRFLKEGYYCNAPRSSKQYMDYWKEVRRKKREGVKLGQVRITGYFYFFLNFHRMKVAVNGEEQEGFGSFWLLHFWIFHLLAYCEIIKKNFVLIKLRGCGMSEVFASVCEADLMIPDLDSTGALKFNTNAVYAHDSRYLNGDDGFFLKVFEACVWLNGNTDLGLHQQFYIQKMDQMQLSAGIRDKSTGQPIQKGGKLKGSVIKKPDDVRGGRVLRQLWEESGANPVLGGSLKTGEPKTMRGGVKTGIQIIWGTSNEDEAGITALKKVILTPGLYKCLAFANVWALLENSDEHITSIPLNPFELIVDESTPEATGYFIPTYDLIKMDEFGNPMRKEALQEIRNERKRQMSLASKDDDEDVLKYIADHPITIEEALTVAKGKYFQNPSLSRQVVNIESRVLNPSIETGYFEFVKNTNKDKIIAVRWYKSPKGKMTILEHPNWSKQIGDYREVKLDSDKISSLFIGGIDSIDQGTSDGDEKGSKLALLIKKRIDPYEPLNAFNNGYVCMYNERPEFVKTAYEQVLCSLIYFHAVALLEYTKIAIKDYICDEMKFAHYLANQPSSPGDTIKGYRKRVRKKGIQVPPDVIIFYLGLIQEYINDYSETIYFVPLLKQLLAYEYEKKKKFDLVVAMGMCELLSRELRDQTIKKAEAPKPLGHLKWVKQPNGSRKMEMVYQRTSSNKNQIVDYYDSKKGEIIYK